MNITIRKGNPSDIDAFIRFLYQVHEDMPQKEWFYLDPPEVFRKMMNDGIMELWFAEDGDTIAGAFDLLIPGLDACNYGYCLGFTQDELMKTINMDSEAVHPNYRGLGLQRKLLQAAEDWLRQRGEWTLLCTIHPDNCFSLNNAQKQGYVIRQKMDMYGSIRYLLEKRLEK